MSTSAVSVSLSSHFDDPQDISHRCHCFPTRYLIAGLLCLGSFTTSMSGAIMNSTILAMAPQRSAHATPGSRHHHVVHHFHRFHTPVGQNHEPDDFPVCSVDASLNLSQIKQDTEHLPQYEFSWSEQKQNLLMIAYYIGMLALLLPCGAAVEHYGGKWICAVGGAGHVILNMVAPWAARTSYWVLFSSRISIGGLEAMVIPSFYYLVTRWIPDNEKSKAIAAMSIGSSLGSIFLNLVSGHLCQRYSWTVVFYLTGIINLGWLLLWCCMAEDTPENHKCTTSTEKEYIESNIINLKESSEQSQSAKSRFRMMSSIPVLATTYVCITHTWFFGVLQTKMPSYMISVLGLNLEHTSIFNTIHQSVLLVSVLANGVISDAVTSGKCCQKTLHRKCFESVATYGTAFFMIILTFTGCNQVSFIVILSLAVACVGSTTGGSDVIIFDLTTTNASMLVSIVSSVNTVFGLFIPSLVTQILDHSNPNGLAQWNNVFYITAVVHCTGGLVFWLFGSAKEQV